MDKARSAAWTCSKVILRQIRKRRATHGTLFAIFKRVDTSNLELESDGFEEIQVRLRFVVPHPCVSKTGRHTT